jgi:hypothetical protein
MRRRSSRFSMRVVCSCTIRTIRPRAVKKVKARGKAAADAVAVGLVAAATLLIVGDTHEARICGREEHYLLLAHRHAQPEWLPPQILMQRVA